MFRTEVEINVCCCLRMKLKTLTQMGKVKSLMSTMSQNGGENKLFASLFPPTELTKASSKGLSSIGRGEEPAAPDKNRVNSSQIGTPQQEASPLLELSSIGRRKEPEAPDRNRVNSSQGKQHDVLEELHSIGRGDEPTALGQNRVNSSQDSQNTEQDHLVLVAYLPHTFRSSVKVVPN